MVKKIIAIACFATLAGCTDADGARKALEGAGYTEISIGGYSAFGCGQDDMYHTEFKAKGATGKPVEGVVCSAPFKGKTIRID